MQRYDVKVWTSYVSNLLALIEMGPEMAAYWGDSASSGSQRQAMFARKVVL